MTTRKLPASANVADKGDGAQMVAPAASRNAAALGDLIERFAPTKGSALEVASGTGQHVLHFAQRCPQLQWQPTDIDPDRLASISAYTGSLQNVARPRYLDALTAGWHQQVSAQDLIVVINLLHLISWSETLTFMSEASCALRSGGGLMVYGPFKRDEKLTSDGDQRFHDALVGQNPEIGYKNDTDIMRLMRDNGLEILENIEMPANNLAFLAKNPDF